MKPKKVAKTSGSSLFLRILEYICAFIGAIVLYLIWYLLTVTGFPPGGSGRYSSVSIPIYYSLDDPSFEP